MLNSYAKGMLIASILLKYLYILLAGVTRVVNCFLHFLLYVNVILYISQAHYRPPRKPSKEI